MRGPSDWSLHGSHEEVTGLWERSWDQEGVSDETTGVHREVEHEATRSGPAAPRAWLIMTAGPSVGQRFAIAEGETRIGRATHCDWVIEAPSISRKHATIELLSDGCWIRDEGANNGTFVEGERIRRRRLETGTFVRLGEVEFRFESDVPRVRSTEEDFTKSRDDPSPRCWVSTLVGTTEFCTMDGLLVDLLCSCRQCLGGGFWLMRYQSEAKRERVEIAHDYYQSGVRAFLERDWDRARQNFVLLEAYDPRHSRANVYRRAIQRERKVETALEEVRAARDRGDLAHGLALLRELPPTVLFEQDVGGLRRALDAEVDSLIARSRADAQAGKWSGLLGPPGFFLLRGQTMAF